MSSTVNKQIYIVRPDMIKIVDRPGAVEGVAGAGFVLIRPVGPKVNGVKPRMIERTLSEKTVPKTTLILSPTT